jgi:hypothetical protein
VRNTVPCELIGHHCRFFIVASAVS